MRLHSRGLARLGAGLLAASAFACPDDVPTETWSVAAQDLREAVMSIGGTSPTDVWAVGADRGEGPLVLHYDGAGWERLQTQERANLWWVHAFPNGPVFMSGGQSTILRYQDGQFERMRTPGLSRHIIFGVWGHAPDDVYAVGSIGAGNGFVWHYDGSEWSVVPLPDSIPKDSYGNTPGLFKVWGDTGGNLWVVGGGGVILRSTSGGPLERVTIDSQAALFTVYGHGDRAFIVGGSGGQPAVYEVSGGGDPVRVDVEGVSLLQGIATSAEGAVYACGAGGTILERTEGGWQSVDTGLELSVQSLHAMWVDPEGGLWSVGGNVLGTTLDKGVILHRGASVPRFVQPALPDPPAPECPADYIDPKPDRSIARRWNEQLLNAIRRDIPRPPVHARNLFHVAAAMYDAWAAYEPGADGYLYTEKSTATDVEAARREAISYAAYRVLAHRYSAELAVGANVSQHCFRSFMDRLGYDPTDEVQTGDSARAIGNRVGAAIIAHGLSDGANEQNNYEDTTGYMAANEPLLVDAGGAQLEEPSLWQELNIVEAETQNGIPLGSGSQVYVGAHWRMVTPFAMTRSGPDAMYHDPGPFPLFGPQAAEWVVEIIEMHSKLDPSLPETIDLSPSAVGNNSLGTNDGSGHALNPFTNQPYPPNVVKLGDFTRVLAEFWADGPKSETPPGHWNTIANEVAERPELTRRLFGEGDPVDELEWDVKTYFALNGATHDAAIAAWEIKRVSLGARPISWARYMANLGQSSDPNLPSYHAEGLPLVADLIELITLESSAPGQRHAHLSRYVGQLAVRSWLGEPGNRKLEYGGVGWMRAAEWMPYQRRNFVTPPFPGFISGHSTYSRSAAEVLAEITGSPFFPGGVGEFLARKDAYLVFERGPSTDVRMQWATYFDAADHSGQSRLWGGIHISPDDFAGRKVGSAVGLAAAARARAFFEGTARD